MRLSQVWESERQKLIKERNIKKKEVPAYEINRPVPNIFAGLAAFSNATASYTTITSTNGISELEKKI